MTDVFADTSFFVALLSDADTHHSTAHQLARSREERLITTVWIIAELGNFLRRPAHRPAFQEMLAELRRDSTALILPAEQILFDAGVELFGNRPDKEWSLTDCISIEVMRGLGIQDALTTDRHFQQAGFRALLLEPR